MLIAIAAAAIAAIVPASAIKEAPISAPISLGAKPVTNPTVCLDDYAAGTRIPLRTCKKLRQWHVEGVFPRWDR